MQIIIDTFEIYKKRKKKTKIQQQKKKEISNNEQKEKTFIEIRVRKRVFF